MGQGLLGVSTHGCTSLLMRGKAGEAVGKGVFWNTLESVGGGTRSGASISRGGVTLDRPPPLSLSFLTSKPRQQALSSRVGDQKSI